jgi:hypothetical protein
MNTSAQLSLDPSALSTFAASLTNLPKEEIRKAKSLFIRNSIADYRMMLKTSKGFLIVLGILSIIPIFLVVFIPSLIGYRASKVNGRQKILNALEVWRSDLEGDYDALAREIETIWVPNKALQLTPSRDAPIFHDHSAFPFTSFPELVRPFGVAELGVR